MYFRVRYRNAGSHVYCRLFVAGPIDPSLVWREGVTLALAGTFTLRAEEFEHLREQFQAEYVEDEWARSRV